MSSDKNTALLDNDTVRDRYLCFRLAEQSFGVPIERVREIVEMQEITPVPHMPEYLKGVVNLRGQIIPVIDLRLRMALPFKEYDGRTCIVMVEHREKLVGLVVDRMEEVRYFDEEHREPAPDYRDDQGMNRFVQSIGREEKRVLMLLDVEEILDNSRVDVGDHDR